MDKFNIRENIEIINQKSENTLLMTKIVLFIL